MKAETFGMCLAAPFNYLLLGPVWGTGSLIVTFFLSRGIALAIDKGWIR
jgi:hypothetical protein